ncbi:MAG: Ig-like domain-containing protein, partial [Limisphaerales bacterium]
MNAIEKPMGKLMLGCAIIACCLTSNIHAQVQFISPKVTEEGAVQLRWQSESNAIYRIDFTQTLSDSIVWGSLVDLFPSQGTNTIFLDTGKYWTEPALPHPKDDTQRFYRVVQVSTNTLVAPTVTITNLTSGTNLSGEVEIDVHVVTTNSIASVNFFVDGEEVEFKSADDNGNASYVINTTEWPNGSHVIFAVAETASGSATTGEFQSTEESGAGTSAIIPVTFDNYISKWSFSLPGFDSSLGETQRITAQFAAYSSWTLAIVDEFETTVRNASGTGTTMAFDWDGKDNNGLDTSDGTYDFILTADQATAPESPSPSNDEVKSLSPMMAALLEGKKSYFVDPPPMPPIQTNGVFVSWEDIYGALPPFEIIIPEFFFEAALSSQVLSTDNPGPATAPQTTRKPKRPPPKPIKGTPGKFGVAWQGNHPDTITGIPGFNRPANLVGTITLDPNYVLPYGAIHQAENIAKNFETTLNKYKWKKAFNYGNDQLTARLLRKPSKGGSNLFNDCNIGLLIGHGIRGTSQDGRATSTPSLQTYMPIYKK